MRFTRRRFLPAVPSALLVGVASATAQDFPARPVRIIVPYATGGSTDVVARLLGPRLSELLGTPVVIDNRPGGSSTIGVDAVAKAAPDGHTLGIVNIGFVANPSLMKKVPYDTQRDLVPVSLLAKSSLVLLVNPSVKARSMQELVALTKAEPGMFYSSAGIGTGSHLIVERLKYLTGIRMTHVPYKGGAPSVMAVMAGETHMVIGSLAASMQHIQAGKLVPVAVGQLKRHELLPQVPSVSEVVPQLEADEWVGLVAPAGTPPAAIERVHAAIAKVLAQADLRSRLVGAGLVPVGNSPREFSAFVTSEIRAWSKVIKEVGITAE